LQYPEKYFLVLGASLSGKFIPGPGNVETRFCPAGKSAFLGPAFFLFGFYKAKKTANKGE